MTAATAVMEEGEIRGYFSSGSTQLGLNLSPLQIEQLMTYFFELMRWNKKMNLTGLRDPRDVLIKNFLDSMTPVSHLSPEQGIDWMDVGTGAGFPGLVLKIVCPDLQMSLVEPTQKKVSFLHHLVGLLGLKGVVIFNERIEALRGRVQDQSYDVLLTRALSPKWVLEKGMPLLRKGGRLLFFQAKFEAAGWKALLENKPFLALEPLHPVSLPFSHDARVLVMIRAFKMVED